ncbi:MAG: hypothetical protein MUF81_07070 [Verrucomicrobia bacterium]|jgi:hypothetical protein|nr:hypothetical protein [Verrucomicrobiota bacterium]
MEDFMTILKNEFDAGEGSFLIKLRPNLEWDKDAFNRLVTAMKLCAESKSSEPKLERWVAEGFWFVSWFVRSWAAHPRFPKDHAADYYERAFSRLDDLAYWYFKGLSPYKDGKHFEDLV